MIEKMIDAFERLQEVEIKTIDRKTQQEIMGVVASANKAAMLQSNRTMLYVVEAAANSLPVRSRTALHLGGEMRRCRGCKN